MTCVAYLVSDYAAPSHTFVRREVEALRAGGMDVAAFSVHPDREGCYHVQGILGRSPVAYIGALFAILISAPGKFVSAWLLAQKHRAPGLRAGIWAQFHFVEAVMLVRLVRKARATRLHVHFANSGATVGLIAAHLADIPFSLTLHGISETDYPAGVMLQDKIERADFVACASNFMRAQALRQVAPEHWPKCHIVRCGIDLDTLDRLSQSEQNTHSDCVDLVCVGRLSPEKGYAGLFEALSRIASDGIAFSLTVVGDGPSGDELRDKIRELGLSEQVHFVGFLKERDTLRAIAKADILVLASLMEGLPAVLIEALALKKPVIAPHIAGIPELVENGINGLMFTPSDWSDLERALRQIIASRGEWTDWGIAGRARIDPEFLIGTSADRMASLFLGEIPA